jgi:hypothetical protein
LFIFGKRWKADGAKSGLYDGCGKIPQPQDFKRFTGPSLMLFQLYEEHSEIFLNRMFATDETWVFHYTPENKTESMTWRLGHTAVKEKLKTVQYPGKEMATFSWGIHGVILVDFTLPVSTIIATAYHKTLKRSK